MVSNSLKKKRLTLLQSQIIAATSAPHCFSFSSNAVVCSFKHSESSSLTGIILQIKLGPPKVQTTMKQRRVLANFYGLFAAEPKTCPP